MDNKKENDLSQISGQTTPSLSSTGLIKGEEFFDNDPYGLFVFKKTERLVSGIYLLTSYLSDKEPLKWSLRELSNNLVLGVLSLSDRVWGEDKIIKDIIFYVGEIKMIFNVAKNTNLVSLVNYEIMQRELDKLGGFLESSSKNLTSAKIAFGKDLFGGDYNFVPNQGNFNSDNSIYKGQSAVKDTVGNQDSSAMSLTKNVLKEKNVKDKGNRQGVILSMLKDGVKLTIKDFSKVIKDCSEKTIQRELLVLVSKGVLKKEGERRWSKYSLI